MDIMEKEELQEALQNLYYMAVELGYKDTATAISYAEEHVLNKPLTNIANSNKVFGFQPVPYNPKPNFELVA